VVIEFLLRLSILVVVVGLFVWDIRRERRSPDPSVLGARMRVWARMRSGG